LVEDAELKEGKAKKKKRREGMLKRKHLELIRRVLPFGAKVRGAGSGPEVLAVGPQGEWAGDSSTSGNEETSASARAAVAGCLVYDDGLFFFFFFFFAGSARLA
jgi:hypothetical protein